MTQATVRRAARPLRTAPFLAIFALLAAACGGSQSSGEASGTTSGGAKATTTTQMAMAMPPAPST
jgi:hypothetical protein